MENDAPPPIDLPNNNGGLPNPVFINTDTHLAFLFWSSYRQPPGFPFLNLNIQVDVLSNHTQIYLHTEDHREAAQEAAASRMTDEMPKAKYFIPPVSITLRVSRVMVAVEVGLTKQELHYTAVYR
ncbi:hypothetical protein RIF29_05185 [Crotalaria pallida]|uniref:Uncharacterized protein n=1 Tax=Crotalaria pallida TaxID=3830 RepID=A0AAN9PAT5_CROPI